MDEHKESVVGTGKDADAIMIDKRQWLLRNLTSDPWLSIVYPVLVFIVNIGTSVRRNLLQPNDNTTENQR